MDTFSTPILGAIAFPPCIFPVSVAHLLIPAAPHYAMQKERKLAKSWVFYGTNQYHGSFDIRDTFLLQRTAVSNRLVSDFLDGFPQLTQGFMGIDAVRHVIACMAKDHFSGVVIHFGII